MTPLSSAISSFFATAGASLWQIRIQLITATRKKEREAWRKLGSFSKKATRDVDFVGEKKRGKGFSFSFPSNAYLAYPSGSDDIAADATREAAWTVFGWLKEAIREHGRMSKEEEERVFFSLARFDDGRGVFSILPVSSRLVSFSLPLYAARKQ